MFICCSFSILRSPCYIYFLTGLSTYVSGANKSIYAPEPFDVGRFLEVDIFSTGQKVLVTTDGPIGPGEYH